MKKLIYIFLFLAIPTIVLSAPLYRIEKTLLPEADNLYDFGTSTLEWRHLYMQGNIINAGFSDGCASWSSGLLTSLGTACGSGGGASGGTWSTTTSQVSGQLINYPNNATDIVTIGANASTTAEWWYDPNVFVGFIKGKLGIGTTSPYATLSVVGQNVASYFTATTTTTSTFPFASSTMITTNKLSVDGTAGQGYIDIVNQSSNPSPPPSGTIRLHATTNNGFTRLEIDNESTTDVVIGRDSVVIVKNTSGGTINKGEVVYITGSTGNVPNIAKAQANSSVTLPSIYVAIDTITNNSFGEVMRSGILSGFDTSAFASGDPVWLATSTAGALINVRPSGVVDTVQRIGTILVSGVGNGSMDIQVAPALLNMETGTNALRWTGRYASTTVLSASTLYATSTLGIASSTPTATLSITGNVAVTPATCTGGATATCDFSTATMFSTSTNQNKTFVFSNAVVGQRVSVSVTNTAGSALTFTWPASVTWGDAGAPTPDAVNGDTDWFTFMIPTSTNTIHGRFGD